MTGCCSPRPGPDQSDIGPTLAGPHLNNQELCPSSAPSPYGKKLGRVERFPMKLTSSRLFQNGETLWQKELQAHYRAVDE